MTHQDGPAGNGGPVPRADHLDEHEEPEDLDDVYLRARRSLTVAVLAPIAVCAAIAFVPAIGGPDPHLRFTAAFTLYAIGAPALLMLLLSTHATHAERYGQLRKDDDDDFT